MTISSADPNSREDADPDADVDATFDQAIDRAGPPPSFSDAQDGPDAFDASDGAQVAEDANDVADEGAANALLNDAGAAQDGSERGTEPRKKKKGAKPRRPRLITDLARSLIDAPDDERIAHIERDKWVPYERADELLARMEKLLHRQITNRPRNIIIIAASNNGKSTLLNEFLKRHQGDDNAHGDALHMPVVLLQAPSEPRKVEFEDAMLQTLNVDPKNLGDKKLAICERLKRYGTRVIMIDEVNNLLAGSATAQRKVANDIRHISNASKASMVMTGTAETLNFLRIDGHSFRRFPPELINRWQPDDKSFKNFLKSYEALLPLRHGSWLEEHADLIYELTQCLMGDVVTLIQDAAVMAIERKQPDQEYISAELLRSCAVKRDVSEDDIARL